MRARYFPVGVILVLSVLTVHTVAWGQFVQPGVTPNSAVAAPTETLNPLQKTLPTSLQKPATPTVDASNTEQMLQSEARWDDSILGPRIAKVTRNLEKIPRDHDQIWREYDITPYTKGRNFPAGSQPEQTIIDWIIRKTGVKTWHSNVFSTLSSDGDKLLVYHTKEVQLVVADIVDRFVSQRYVNDSCKIRVITLSRPDWIGRNHQYLRPVKISSPGIQGWMLERDGAALLLQDLARRADFKEIAPPQFLLSNGVAYHNASLKQRSYLRDVQPNAAALNGYAEDRVTMDEGFGLSFVPLAQLDDQSVEAMIKLDIVQVEKMIPLMIDAPTTTNPRQRIQIEAPQVACFKLDEMLWWPKNKILLLDLGTIPMPGNAAEQTESPNIFAGLTKNLGGSRRANVLLFIEHTGNTTNVPAISGAAPTAPQQPQTPAIGANSPYWQGIR